MRSLITPFPAATIHFFGIGTDDESIEEAMYEMQQKRKLYHGENHPGPVFRKQGSDVDPNSIIGNVFAVTPNLKLLNHTMPMPYRTQLHQSCLTQRRNWNVNGSGYGSNESSLLDVSGSSCSSDCTDCLRKEKETVIYKPTMDKSLIQPADTAVVSDSTVDQEA